MKKTNWIIAGAFALGLAIAPQATAHAEDTPSPSKSTASFVANPGELTLVKVPDMNFGTTSVQDLIAGTTLEYQNGNADTNGMSNTSNANQDGTLQVADYRGTSAGWQLSAQAAPFTADHNAVTLGTTTLTFSPMVDTDQSGTQANNLATNTNIYNTNAQIWSADATGTTPEEKTGTGTNTVTFTQGIATLKIGATPSAVSGTYQSQITWTLASAPDGQGN